MALAHDQVLPEGVRVVGAGETAAHPDDRDRHGSPTPGRGSGDRVRDRLAHGGVVRERSGDRGGRGRGAPERGPHLRGRPLQQRRRQLARRGVFLDQRGVHRPAEGVLQHGHQLGEQQGVEAEFGERRGRGKGVRSGLQRPGEDPGQPGDGRFRVGGPGYGRGGGRGYGRGGHGRGGLGRLRCQHQFQCRFQLRFQYQYQFQYQRLKLGPSHLRFRRRAVKSIY